MDIRTKLIFAVVAVSLCSMALLSYFSYQIQADLLRDITSRQLNALAETKKRDIEKVYASWQDQVRLIRSRTQLRHSLKTFLDNGDAEALVLVERIMNDAAQSVNNVDRITIYSLDGTMLVRAGNSIVPSRFVLPESPDNIQYSGTYPIPSDYARVVFHALMSLDGTPLAVVEVVRNATDVTTVSNNYAGLGETGETFIAMIEPEGRVFILNPLRHEAGARFLNTRVPSVSPDIEAALHGETLDSTAGITDYRGINVWSATRFLPELEWGLIVKVDEEEELSRISKQREVTIDLVLALSAFAVVCGMLMGLYLASPIRELAEVVERIRGGDMDVRATVRGDDEIAFLAESINELMEDMKNLGITLPPHDKSEKLS